MRHQDIEELTKMAGVVESASTKYAGLQGEERQLRTQMESQFNIKSVRQAQKIEKEIGEEMTTLGEQLKEGVDALHEEFEEAIKAAIELGYDLRELEG
jgi:uncharacterized coiled-coil DUF342 family protein